MNTLHNFTFALFLLLCYSSHVLSISPVYFFNSTFDSEIGGKPLTFNELNLNTNTIQTLDSIKFEGKGYSNEEFFGIVIYYKTGVLYANYWQIIGPETYQSNLLAVDTSTGKLLFKDFKYCEGMVSSGLAIDQTNGDIHFLNSTGPFESYGLTVDWTKWNIENNITTIIQNNANTNAGPYGAIVFNSLTNSLIELDILGENLYIYQANLPLLNITIDGSWFMMTINSKTGDLIVGTSDPSPAVDILLVTVNGSNLNKKILCHFPAVNYSFVSSNDASDFDYASNTWVAGLEEADSEKYGGPYNAFFHVNIDTCAEGFYYDSSNENKILQGIPRFNSGSSF